MPRQLLLSSLSFLAPMEHWATKEDELGKQAEEASLAEQYESNDDFFGGGDVLDAARDGDPPKFTRSHYVALTCCKSLFYVMTPMVAMCDDFEAISEEDLDLFKLTPTLDFTLSLNLNFHGNEDRSTKTMFESLGKIRFLRDLKVFGRISENDFKQIGQLHFLESLDLSAVSKFTDDILPSLYGLVNLRRLDLTGWNRLTKKGMDELPKIAPNLECLLLSHPAAKSKGSRSDSSSAFFSGVTDSSIAKSLKTLVLSNASALGDSTMTSLSKLARLESLKLDWSNFNIYSIAGNSFPSDFFSSMRYLRKFDCSRVRSAKELCLALGKHCGHSLEVLNVGRQDERGDDNSDQVTPELFRELLTILVKYFKSLHYLFIGNLETGGTLYRFLLHRLGVEQWNLRQQRSNQQHAKKWMTLKNKTRKKYAEHFLTSYSSTALETRDEVEDFFDIIRNQDVAAWKKLEDSSHAEIPKYEMNE